MGAMFRCQWTATHRFFRESAEARGRENVCTQKKRDGAQPTCVAIRDAAGS